MKKNLLKYYYISLLAGIYFLSIFGCQNRDEKPNASQKQVTENRRQGNDQDQTTPANKQAMLAEQYLKSLQVIGPWRDKSAYNQQSDTTTSGNDFDDAAYKRELQRTIDKNAARVDPETGFLWGVHSQPKGYHSRFDHGTKVRPTREAMYYAALLIASSDKDHQVEGRRLLEKVIALQDTDRDSPTFGIWPWYYEESLSEMATPDYNWADFLGAVLASLLHDYRDRLPPELLEKVQKSLEYASLAIIKRDVKPSYTNIAMMGATVTAAAGELLGRDDFLDYGRMRIRRNLEHYRETGNFNEYNSPNYTPVVINELERMLYLVDDPTCRKAASELLVAAWQTVAEHYHVPTRQWAGPFSRTYADTISPRSRNMILAQALVISPEERAALPDNETVSFSPFVPRLACPESLRHYFIETPQSEITRRHVFNRERLEIGTTWLTPTATLGSASYHTFWTQTRGLIGYWHLPDSEEPAVLKLAFKHDGNDFASACARNMQSDGKVLSAIGLLRNQGSMHPTFDRPQDGVFVAESFEIVYQLKAPGARAVELSPGVFELSADPVRAVLHVAEDCIFDGLPVKWHIRQSNEDESSSEMQTVALIGVCYRGEPKKFEFHSLGETRIGVGLEFLQGDRQPSTARVMLADAVTPKNQDGIYYAVRWEPVTNDAPEKTLTAPAFPTNR